MPLLFDDDYEIINHAHLEIEEDEASRFLVFKNFPLPNGMYTHNNAPIKTVEVLYIVPPTYNTEGGDMFWVYPPLSRADRSAIPNVNGPNQDSRIHNGIEYVRWSRHWNRTTPWKPKIDNVQTIINRITWAFKYPSAKRPK